jgi:nucleoside-diphosphate-sugar epimerase
LLDLSSTDPVPLDCADVVVHIAAEKRDESRMWTVNFDATDRLLHWAARHGARRFVLLSSVGVYGAPLGSGPVTERHLHTPANVYERSKDAAEGRAREFCEREGIECIVLQPSNVIGHHPDGAGVYPLLTLMRAVKKGLVFRFGGDAWTNYVSVGDVADALVRSTLDAPTGTYIINEPIRLREFLDLVAATVGARSRHLRLPHALGTIAGEIGSLAERFARRPFPVNRERVRELGNNTRYVPDASRQRLGVDYAHGVRDMICSFAAEYASRGWI